MITSAYECAFVLLMRWEASFFCRARARADCRDRAGMPNLWVVGRREGMCTDRERDVLAKTRNSPGKINDLAGKDIGFDSPFGRRHDEQHHRPNVAARASWRCNLEKRVLPSQRQNTCSPNARRPRDRVAGKSPGLCYVNYSGLWAKRLKLDLSARMICATGCAGYNHAGLRT